MPSRELPGDINMPRVQAASFGASERFVVEPGHEEFGFFHMPADKATTRSAPSMARAIGLGSGQGDAVFAGRDEVHIGDRPCRTMSAGTFFAIAPSDGARSLRYAK